MVTLAGGGSLPVPGKHLNPSQAQWALFFTRFNLTVTYWPGMKNSNALARQHDPVG